MGSVRILSEVYLRTSASVPALTELYGRSELNCQVSFVNLSVLGGKKGFPRAESRIRLLKRITNLRRSLAHSASHRASNTTILLHVAIEPGLSPTAPVSASVIIRPRPAAQKTEEHVPRRSDHNSRMPPPHHQIRSLRLRHSLKSRRPVVQVVRTRVRIRKSRPLVDRMHHVRAVMLRVSWRFRIQRRGNHRQPVIRTQRPLRFFPASSRGALPLRRFRSRLRRRFRKIPPRVCWTHRRVYRRLRIPIVPARRSPLLRPRNTNRQPTEPDRKSSLPPIRHGPILMPFPHSASVTVVQQPDPTSAPSVSQLWRQPLGLSFMWGQPPSAVQPRSGDRTPPGTNMV